MKNSLADRAYEAIKSDIIHCVLEPGMKLPLAELVERYHFGITPTREAMKLLEQEGYLQAIPRYGYIINPITIEDVQDIFELRAALEKTAVRLAALRATDQQIREIMDAVYEKPEGLESPSELPTFMKRNHGFHVIIARASGNRRLLQAISKVLDEQMRILEVYFKLEPSEDGLDRDHHAIAEAIKNRDADLAESLMEYDVNWSLPGVQKRIRQSMGRIM